VLQQVFPDETVVSRPQRQQVISVIDQETLFGQLSSKIAAALDAAQGTVHGNLSRH
jgi:hypothetical protein